MPDKFLFPPQFVPSRVCMTCDGCCRFKDDKSPWRPKVSDHEIHINSGLAEMIFSGSERQEHFLKTVNVDGQCQCSFFDQKTNACRIYAYRPFECRLYPFILYKKENTIDLCIHLSCPYILEKRYSSEFEEFLGQMKQFFAEPTVIEFVRQNQFLAGDYREYESELESILTLSLN